jgi:hypothetical protein
VAGTVSDLYARVSDFFYWVCNSYLCFDFRYYYFMLKNAPFLEFVFGIVYWTAISVMLAAAANAQHFALMAKTEFPFLFGELLLLLIFFL